MQKTSALEVRVQIHTDSLKIMPLLHKLWLSTYKYTVEPQLSEPSGRNTSLDNQKVWINEGMFAINNIVSRKV